MASAKSSTARGYGKAHREARAIAAVLVASGQATCCLCREPIAADAQFDLDHTPDRTGYRGVAHPSCNRSDGARRQKRQTARRWAL